MNLLNIMPWWTRWAAIAALVAAACGYTGLKVAGHYQDAAADVRAVGRAQVARVAAIEIKQTEVVKNAQTSAVSAIALSDAYYSMRHGAAGSRGMPDAASLATGLEQPAAAIPADTSGCTDQDSAADAIVVVQLQDFYNNLRKVQK